MSGTWLKFFDKVLADIAGRIPRINMSKRFPQVFDLKKEPLIEIVQYSNLHRAILQVNLASQDTKSIS